MIRLMAVMDCIELRMDTNTLVSGSPIRNLEEVKKHGLMVLATKVISRTATN